MTQTYDEGVDNPYGFFYENKRKNPSQLFETRAEAETEKTDLIKRLEAQLANLEAIYISPPVQLIEKITITLAEVKRWEIDFI